MNTTIVILAAGKGSRLGRELPKPLTTLHDGRSIMQQQIENIHAAFGSDAQVTAVVGYEAHHVVDAFPNSSYVYNDDFDTTNTSKSLLKALLASGDDGVLWMNGDVVFDPEALVRAAALIEGDRNFMTVNTSSVSDEEVKYTVDAEGFINEVSKVVTGGLGEAVGINFISAADKPKLIARLTEVDDQDYFERGIELAIQRDSIQVEPLDISDLFAVEIDFAEDLVRANSFVDR